MCSNKEKKEVIGSIRKYLLLIRPFQLVFQICAIFFVISIKNELYTISIIDFIKIMIMSLLITPILFTINDFLHRKKDIKMGRDRLFTSSGYSRTFLLLINILCLFLMTIIALSFSILTFFLIYFQIIVSILYGYLKKKKIMILTYFSRGIMAITYYLLLASCFSLDFTDFKILWFIFLLDISVNIAGDLRDYNKDKKGNIITLPVKYGKSITLLVISLIQISSFIILYIFIFDIGFNLQFSLSVCWLLVAWILYSLICLKNIGIQWEHAVFHGPKCQIYLWIGSAYITPEIDLIIFIPLTFLIFIFWYGSYKIYLWSDNSLYKDKK